MIFIFISFTEEYLPRHVVKDDVDEEIQEESVEEIENEEIVEEIIEEKVIEESIPLQQFPQPPSDDEIRQFIEKLAGLVVTHGDQVENQAVATQSENPKFFFLFQHDSDEYKYYSYYKKSLTQEDDAEIPAMEEQIENEEIINENNDSVPLDDPFNEISGIIDDLEVEELNFDAELKSNEIDNQFNDIQEQDVINNKNDEIVHENSNNDQETQNKDDHQLGELDFDMKDFDFDETPIEQLNNVQEIKKIQENTNQIEQAITTEEKVMNDENPQNQIQAEISHKEETIVDQTEVVDQSKLNVDDTIQENTNSIESNTEKPQEKQETEITNEKPIEIEENQNQEAKKSTQAPSKEKSASASKIIKCFFGDKAANLKVSTSISLNDLKVLLSKKFNCPANNLILKYRDDCDDLVIIEGNDDLEIAFELSDRRVSLIVEEINQKPKIEPLSIPSIKIPIESPASTTPKPNPAPTPRTARVKAPPPPPPPPAAVLQNLPKPKLVSVAPKKTEGKTQTMFDEMKSVKLAKVSLFFPPFFYIY